MSPGPFDETGGTTRPAGPAGRSGHAARRPAASPRRTTTPARKRLPDSAAALAAGARPEPAAPATDAVAEALAVALAAIADEQVRDWVNSSRPTRFSDGEWALVADLFRLGVAVYQPPTLAVARRLGWIVGVHTRVQLDAGTSRTVTGWYHPDVIEATLAAQIPGVERRSLATAAGRLRSVAARLVPPAVPAALGYGHYAPNAPYSTAELTRLLDFADDHPQPTVRRRLSQLLWLGLGAGPYDSELPALTGASLRWGTHALLLDLPGVPGKAPARTVPVFHAAEAPLAALAADAGSGSLWPGMNRREGLASALVESAKLPAGMPRLTSTRLRATRLALIVAADAPLRAVLSASGVKGDRTFGQLTAFLSPMDAACYQQALRGADGPLPTADPQLLLPGRRHPAPDVPHRTDPPAGAP